MEITEKKIIANRKNGLKGGIKTLEGKQKSKMNSLKHGIMARFTTKYDDLNYNDVFEMFSQEFGATSLSRTILIEQLSITYMRLRRCIRYESEIIREALNPPKYESVIGEESRLVTLVNEGEPATIKSDSFEQLENVITKYEPNLLSRLIKLLEILKND